uniref:Alpha-carbonic anhydrase domain-containing protein n=1 Tax=Timema shepardi TaxID=629360 RepID=A0A7R9B1S6_TIMSH|nr:unnamed protein product [Timema shepardi]
MASPTVLSYAEIYYLPDRIRDVPSVFDRDIFSNELGSANYALARSPASVATQSLARSHACLVAVTNCADWSYAGSHGPEQWTGLCNTGLKQSPVDLDKGVATRSYFHDLELFNYDKPTFINITNNGHTVRLDVEQPCTMSLAAGGLPGVYHLEQIHFHWPSEHTIQGNKWPLEVHLVHYDRKYPNVKEAVRHPQGLAVLAILYHVSDNNHACLVRILECIVWAMELILLDIECKVVLDTHSIYDSFGVDFVQWKRSVANTGDDERLHRFCFVGANVLAFHDV